MDKAQKPSKSVCYYRLSSSVLPFRYSLFVLFPKMLLVARLTLFRSSPSLGLGFHTIAIYPPSFDLLISATLRETMICAATSITSVEVEGSVQHFVMYLLLCWPVSPRLAPRLHDTPRRLSVTAEYISSNISHEFFSSNAARRPAMPW
jgi:hypothetical protein